MIGQVQLFRLCDVPNGRRIKIGVLSSGHFSSIDDSGIREKKPTVHVIGHNGDIGRFPDCTCIGWNTRIIGVCGCLPSGSWDSQYKMVPEYMDFHRCAWVSSQLLVETAAQIHIPNQKCASCQNPAPHKKPPKGKYVCAVCKVLGSLV